MNLANQHVFITAKHLLDDSPDKNNLFISFNTTDGQANYIKLNILLVNNLGQDISFFIPTLDMQKKYKNNLIPLNPLRHTLPIGQSVLIYGFPDRKQHGFTSGIPLVKIQRRRYEGNVVEIEKNCLYPIMSTYYKLDIPSPKGLSGSPVLVVYNNELVVTGYIIGQQETDGRALATSSDFKPFDEIEKLLIDYKKTHIKNKN